MTTDKPAPENQKPCNCGRTPLHPVSVHLPNAPGAAEAKPKWTQQHIDDYNETVHGIRKPKPAPEPPRCLHPFKQRKEGASRGYDIVWCADCGLIIHCNDGRSVEREKYSDWLKANVVAFGCNREAQGRGAACEEWCGNIDCPVSLREKPKPAPEPQEDYGRMSSPSRRIIDKLRADNEVLRSERASAEADYFRVRSLLNGSDYAAMMERAQKAEAERDALAAKLAESRKAADYWSEAAFKAEAKLAEVEKENKALRSAVRYACSEDEAKADRLLRMIDKPMAVKPARRKEADR